MLENSSRTDSNEEIWSRGSMAASSDNTSPTNIFPLDHKKLYEKPQLFQYEQGGILVYLSKAHIVGDPHKPTPKLTPSENYLSQKLNSKLFESISLADKKAFLEAKKLSSAPVYSEEVTLEIPKFALRFNSKFESGNLSKVIMISESQYKLYIEKEPGNVCLQWYYFEVRNKKLQNVTFRIVNLGKFESLYNEGMKPLVRSLKDDNTWKRSGTNISYSPNSENSSYTLTFTYQFTHSEDQVHFAYSYPYTYTDLSSDLEKILKNHKEIARVDKISESLCNNSVFMITITEDLQKYFSFTEEKSYSRISAAQRNLLRKRKIRSGCKNEFVHKKGVFLTSRVHPGETVSSFMMQGVIEFLLSNNRSALILRKNFVFKLIPMLNPDGVRYGKTRVSMIGADLNRNWLEPSALLHPCIFSAKQYLKVFSEMHECLLFCDFHGHSVKKNVFFYGCNEKPTDLEQGKKNVIARVVPFLLGRRNKLVSYMDCRFRMEKSKESTARISIFKQFGIVNSLTCEASFYGPSSSEAYNRPRTDLHMLPSDLMTIGRDLCLSLFVFLSPIYYIKTLQNISKNLRDPSPSKPTDSEDLKPFDFHQDILNCDEAWVNLRFDYKTESSSSPSASDIDDPSFIHSKKPSTALRRPIKTFTRRPSKPQNPKKSEINLSPEAFFKIPGISVFSFNLRTKSSELLNKFPASRSVREKFRGNENETKQRFSALRCESRSVEKVESSRVRVQSVEKMNKDWVSSKSGVLLKQRSYRREGERIAGMLINKFPIGMQK